MCAFADFLVCFPSYLFSCVLFSHTTIHCYHVCWFYILSLFYSISLRLLMSLSSEHQVSVCYFLWTCALCFSYHVPFAEKKTGLSEVIIIWSSKTSYWHTVVSRNPAPVDR